MPTLDGNGWRCCRFWLGCWQTGLGPFGDDLSSVPRKLFAGAVSVGEVRFAVSGFVIFLFAEAEYFESKAQRGHSDPDPGNTFELKTQCFNFRITGTRALV